MMIMKKNLTLMMNHIFLNYYDDDESLNEIIPFLNDLLDDNWPSNSI